ncbi:15587_t:CDS:2 [Funneliformis caledonium]|uniref:15587_t:CDS:1 n=1 Tax=Funneliformis caledonium TaxID=1117310 RepID=A0A9N9DI67_9GLOM|nr:15587_t:CDS:2 [Funneliformis caledonium]
MLSRSPLELGKKRPITEEEETTELKRSKWDTRKWDTNGAIRKAQRTGVYFVDPLTLSEPLLDRIREGEFMALYGARATGKTTRVFRVMEQLEEEGYICK